MEVVNSKFPDVKIIKIKSYSDSRGFFFESFNKKEFEKLINYKVDFVQDNHSSSFKGVFRGFHYQKNPFAQDKLIRVIKGSIIDFVIDIRKDSVTYGQHLTLKLSAKSKNQLWIPKGFAHGFLSLTENTQIIYKVTSYYNPVYERFLRHDDPDLNINWEKIKFDLKIKKLILSKKDLHGKSLKELEPYNM